MRIINVADKYSDQTQKDKRKEQTVKIEAEKRRQGERSGVKES